MFPLHSEVVGDGNCNCDGTLQNHQVCREGVWVATPKGTGTPVRFNVSIRGSRSRGQARGTKAFFPPLQNYENTKGNNIKTKENREEKQKACRVARVQREERKRINLRNCNGRISSPTTVLLGPELPPQRTKRQVGNSTAQIAEESNMRLGTTALRKREELEEAMKW